MSKEKFWPLATEYSVIAFRTCRGPSANKSRFQPKVKGPFEEEGDTLEGEEDEEGDRVGKMSTLA